MILRPFFYDLRRTITSKSVLILTAITLLISLTIVPLTNVNTSFGGASAANVLYYRDNNGHHFLAYSANQYGKPLSGSSISITLTPSPPTGTNYTQTGQTNSTGLAFLSLNAPNGTYFGTISSTIGSAMGTLTFYLQGSPQDA